MSPTPRIRHHVVIAGGGVAALETLLALRALAGHRARITLLSHEREFLYRPVTVAEPFERGEARAYQLADIVAEQGADFVCDALAQVDADQKVAITRSGKQIVFDTLVVATGAVARNPLPGAITFTGRSDVAALRAVLEELVQGGARSLALTLPAERMWPLPLYELALMTAGHLREHGADGVAVTVVTPEDEPLQLFGPAASEALTSLLRARGVRLRTSSLPALVQGRFLVLAGGAHIFAEKVITLPALEGPSLPGLPCDEHGFIPVDVFGRVSDCPDIYAVGDVTTFPLKQGGLAAQQADAAAEMIASELGAVVEPGAFTPVLRGLLMTGGAPLYLRAEPHRTPRSATIATEATPIHRTTRDASAAAGQALWWPPAKIAARYLAPYLATARPQPLEAQLLSDRVAIPGPRLSNAEHRDALELALLLADCDARWGDFRSALHALDAAEGLQGALPPEYEAKRRAWRAGRTVGDYVSTR